VISFTPIIIALYWHISIFIAVGLQFEFPQVASSVASCLAHTKWRCSAWVWCEQRRKGAHRQLYWAVGTNQSTHGNRGCGNNTDNWACSQTCSARPRTKVTPINRHGDTATQIAHTGCWRALEFGEGFLGWHVWWHDVASCSPVSRKSSRLLPVSDYYQFLCNLDWYILLLTHWQNRSDHAVVPQAAQALLADFPWLAELEKMTRIHLNGGTCRIEGRLVSVSELNPIRSKVRASNKYQFLSTLIDFFWL
jgi:hypothetical protein